MDIKLLKTFVTFSKSKNIQEAASVLGITQPAVTQQIQALEATFPVPLFNIEGRKKVLTRAGQELFNSLSLDIGKLEDKFERCQRRFSNPNELTLRIGGRVHFLRYIFPYINYKGKVLLQNMPTEDAFRELNSKKLDIVISHRTPKEQSLLRYKLFNSGGYLVIAKSIYKHKAIIISEIIKNDFIGFIENSEFMLSWREHNNISAKDIKNKFIMNDWEMVSSAVESGLGFSIIPDAIKINFDKVHAFKLSNKELPIVPVYAYYPSDLKDLFKISDLIKKIS